MKRWTGPARVLFASLLVVAALFVFVFPTSAYLAQRRQIGGAQHRVDVVRAQNRVLAREAARLKDPEQIAEIAREQYHLVRPGETAFAVIPAPDESTTVPTTAPASTPTTTTRITD